MVRGDGGGGVSAGLRHILRSLSGGDVFEDDVELRKVAAQRHEVLVDEHRFAVKQINLRIGHFTVYQQRHANTLHGFKGFMCVAQIGDTCAAVGGGTGGIQLHRHHTTVVRTVDFIGRRVVGQVKRHQGLERVTCGQSRLYALLVRQSLRGGGDRRLQIRHDHGTGELRGGMGHHCSQCIAIAQVHMPIIGANQRECV